jgi:hypothetical protein
LVDEMGTIGIRFAASPDVLERVRVDQLSPDSIAEECPSEATTASHGCRREWLLLARLGDCVFGFSLKRFCVLLKISAKVVSISRRDAADWPICPEHADQIAARVSVERLGAVLHVGSSLQIAFKKLAERNQLRWLTRLNELHRRELL